MDVVFDDVTHHVDQYRATPGQMVMWSSGPIDPNQTHGIICRKTSADNGGMDVNIDAFMWECLSRGPDHRTDWITD